MKKIYISAFLLSALFISAQKYKSTNDSIYQKAVEFLNKDEFDKGIGLLNTISKYSPEAHEANFERIRALYGKKKHSEVIGELKKIDLQTLDREQLINYYYLLGNAYDDSGNGEKSIETYNEGLKSFPNAYLLYYNRGVTLVKQKKNKEALEDFQKSIQIYPNYPKSHYFAGLIALENGNLAEGTLAVATSILFDGRGVITTEAIKSLNEIVSQKYNEPEDSFAIEGSDAFSSIETVLRKQYALNKDYKLNSQMDFPVVRQLQAIISEVPKIKERKGFFAKQYLDFYTQLWNNNQFENFSYALFNNFDNKDIKNLVSKKSKDVKSFSEWLVPTAFKTIITTEKNGERVYVVSEGEYIGYGKNVNDKKNGPWLYNYSFGDKAVDVNFVNGQKTSSTFYHKNGKIANKLTYKNDVLNGTVEYFYDNGNPEIKKVFINDKQVDKQETYYYLGGTKCTTGVKDDKKEGYETCFYSNGNKKSSYNYQSGNAEGNGQEFYPDGAVKSTAIFVKNYYNGERKTFFPDKKPENIETYTNGKASGEHKSFSANGDVASVVTLDKNKDVSYIVKYIGKYKSEERFFENGRQTKQIDYLMNKPFLEYLFEGKAGEEYISFYKTYDENGKSSPEIKIEKNKPFEIKTPYGNTHFSGMYNKNGKKQGEWKIYNMVSGIYENHTYYEDGKQVNKYEEFFANGNPKLLITIANEKKNGPYITYYENGKKSSEYTFVNDVENGEIKLYYNNGKLKSAYFLNDGDIEGTIENYDLDGKLSKKSIFVNGESVKDDFYYNDKLVNSIDYNKQGKAKYASKTDNEFTEGTIKNGSFEGSYTLVSKKNEKIFETSVTGGKKYGEGINYNPNGSKYIVTSYLNNETYGDYTSYDLYGRIYSKSKYYHDLEYGPFEKYLPSGKKYIESQYFEDKRHGQEKIIGSNGEILVTLNYDNGNLVSYQQQGEAAPTLVKNGNASIKANYKNGKLGIEYNIVASNIDGDYNLYSEAGTPLIKAKYKKGFIEGERQIFLDNGKIYLSETLINGNYEGKRKIFYENGKVKIEADYVHDYLHGNYVEYDANGKIILNKKYDYDVLVGYN